MIFKRNEISIRVYSTLGSLIDSFMLRESKKLNISKYPKGVLLFKIKVEGLDINLDEKIIHI